MALLVEPDGKRNWVAVDERCEREGRGEEERRRLREEKKTAPPPLPAPLSHHSNSMSPPPLHTHSDQRYSLKPAQIEYVLPGDGHTPASLAAAAAVAADAAADVTRRGDTWELLSDPAPTPATVPELAAFLFGEAAGPGEVAAARRLVGSTPDGVALFKAGKGKPVLYSPRPAVEVAALRAQAAAAEKAAADAAAVAADFADAATAGDWGRKTATLLPAWRASPPHAARLAALDELALEHASPAAAASALSTLRSVSSALRARSPSSADPYPPTSDGAAALLSAIGARPRHELPGLRRAGVTVEFPPGLEAAATSLAAAPPADPDMLSRADLTATHTIMTIDDASTTEIDDGLSVEWDGGGRTGGQPHEVGDFTTATLWVHIADPTRWLAPPSPAASSSICAPLIEEAARRTRTVYLPTGSIPMFPRPLSDGPFSLRPGVPTAALSVGVRLRGDGSLDAGSIVIRPSTISPAARLTYDGVDSVLAAGDGTGGVGGGSPPPASPDDSAALAAVASDLRLLAAAATARRAWRTAQGAATFSLPEADVRVRDVEGAPPSRSAATVYLNGKTVMPVGGGLAVAVGQIVDTPSRRLVSELMILANEAVATAAGAAGLPLPYRGQVATPPREEEAAARAALEGSDPPPPPPPPPTSGPAAAAAARSRMMRGVLDCAAPAPHAGLGLAAYTQFTSPIRRWGDLCVHWQVKAWVRGGGGPVVAGGVVGGGGGATPPPPLPFPTPDALAAAVTGPASIARELAGMERGAEAEWLARFFSAADAGSPPAGRSLYPATVLSWLRPDAGIAKILLDGLGVEAVGVLGGAVEVGGPVSVAFTGLGTPHASRPPDLRFEDWPPAGSGGVVAAAIPSAAVVAASAELEEVEGGVEEDE